MKIYLAGPIEMCSTDEIKLWREYTKEKIHHHEFVEPRPNLTDSVEIFETNKFDVENTDMTFAFLPRNINARRSSYGTIFEISYAYALGKKVVIVSDDEYVHEHPVMKEIGEHFNTLDDALRML